MSLGRHPEPGFRVANFQPLQVRSRGTLTTAALRSLAECQERWFKEFMALAGTAGDFLSEAGRGDDTEKLGTRARP